FVAFLAHVKNAPERFPPITKVSISAMLGFAPAVEAPPAAPDAVADQARQAVDAGIPYLQPYVDSARQSVAAFFGTNADAVAFANLTGLVVSGLFFLLGLYLLARQETTMR
ncbi:MAG: hypothetical protein SFV54_16490, partial [Bryobacteraceae bacterium]|nr:hypothetical protein [Bryobacteraceae bacterium]